MSARWRESRGLEARQLVAPADRVPASRGRDDRCGPQADRRWCAARCADVFGDRKAHAGTAIRLITSMTLATRSGSARALGGFRSARTSASSLWTSGSRRQFGECGHGNRRSPADLAGVRPGSTDWRNRGWPTSARDRGRYPAGFGEKDGRGHRASRRRRALGEQASSTPSRAATLIPQP